MTPCEEYWEALNALVDGECTPEEEAALRAHLAVCPGCRAALADLEAVQAVCEEWAGEPDDFTDAEFVDVPEGFAQRVLARAAETPQLRAQAEGKARKGRKSRSRGYGATWAALAACLALMVCLEATVFPFRRGANSSPASEDSTGNMASTAGAAEENGVSPQAAGKDDRSKRMTDEDVLTAAEADVCWELTAAEERELLTGYGYDWQETETGRVYTLTVGDLEVIRMRAQGEDILLSLPWEEEAAQNSDGAVNIYGAYNAAGGSEPERQYELAGTPEKGEYRILVLPPEDE